MAHVESRFNKRVVSPKGACGVMQVMPDTAKLYGVSRKELFNEDINIQVGLTYFKEMLRIFGNKDLALAAYNAGPAHVIGAGHRIPRIRETIDYVRRVNRAARGYKQKRS
ncbi:MAG: lytic transglycosylase domain-containing protein [Pseudomonadota bacterium]